MVTDDVTKLADQRVLLETATIKRIRTSRWWLHTVRGSDIACIARVGCVRCSGSSLMQRCALHTRGLPRDLVEASTAPMVKRQSWCCVRSAARVVARITARFGAA